MRKLRELLDFGLWFVLGSSMFIFIWWTTRGR